VSEPERAGRDRAAVSPTISPRGQRVFDISAWLACVADVALSVPPTWRTPYLLSVASVIVVIGRYRFPRTVCLLSVPGLLYGYALIAPVLALFTLVIVRELSWRRSCGWAVPLVLSQTIVFPLREFADESISHVVLSLGYAVLYAAAAIGLGQAVVTRRRLVASIAEAKEQRGAREAISVQNAVTAERLRISRELHDVVAHQVTMVSIRAGTLGVQSQDPVAREAAADIRALTGATLTELRAMLSLLHAPGGAISTPGLDDVDELVAATGMPVDIDYYGDLGGVDPAVSRAAYRVLQETLTNAHRHAPGASVRVTVDNRAGGLRLTVHNTAATSSPEGNGTAGLGLLGLRERVQALGGTMAAGPDDDGWTVRVDFPAIGVTSRETIQR
jgi:signal transduction histidine kinase